MFALLKRAGAAMLALGLVFALQAPAVAAPEVTLKLHHFLGPKSPANVKMLEPWAKRIEDDSKGRIKIEIFPSMSLGGKPPELIRQVQEGVVDIIWTVNGYTAGLYPRTEVFELPFVHTNDLVATNLAMADMYDKYLAPEYDNVHVLFLHVHAGQAIHTVDKEVHKPSDLKGLKMRIPTRTGAWVIEAMGANPVGMPVPDLPQALSKKVVDGALIPWEIIAPLKLQELTDYQIEGADKTRFGTTTFQVSMNKDKWNSLPKDLQEVFTKNSGREWLKEIGQIWRDVDEAGIKLATDAGNKHITLTAEETKAFETTLTPVVDRWVDEVSEKGIDGKELVKTAREAIAKNASK